MSQRRKEILTAQKGAFEKRLADRLALLAEKGVDEKKVKKDALVRAYKADVKAADRRLKAIAAHEAITAEAAKVKAERAAAPKEEKPAKAEKAEKAEKPKKGGDEAKEKKPKPEKKAAPAKA